MIALPAPITAKYATGPVMIIAMDASRVFFIEADGTMSSAPHDLVNVDWRYDFEHEVWLDLGPYTEEEDGESDQEAPDDGSAEVPGRVPDPDRTSGGDPGDGEDGETWGLDPGETED